MDSLWVVAGIVMVLPVAFVVVPAMVELVFRRSTTR